MNDALPPEVPDLADAASCRWSDAADAAALRAFADACLAVLDGCEDETFGNSTSFPDPNGLQRPSTFGTHHLAPDGRQVMISRGLAREAERTVDEYAITLTRTEAPPIAFGLRIAAVAGAARPGRDQARALARRVAALADRLATGRGGAWAPAQVDAERRLAAVAGLLAHHVDLAGTAKLALHWDPSSGVGVMAHGPGEAVVPDGPTTALLRASRPFIEMHLRTGSTGKTWFPVVAKATAKVPATPPDAVATMRSLADLGLVELPSLRPEWWDSTTCPDDRSEP